MKWWPRGQQWQVCERFWLEAPDWSRDCWQSWSGWHGGDEYENCSIYFRTGLLGGFVFFYELDFQRDVLAPEGHVHPWFDRRYDPEYYEQHKDDPGYLPDQGDDFPDEEGRQDDH